MKLKFDARHSVLPLALIAAYGAGRLTPAMPRAQAAASTRIAAAGVAAPITKPLAPIVQRRAFRFHIRAEKAAGYKAWHRRVAPQLLRDLSNAGVRNYSLYLAKDGTVFGYMESVDWARVDREMSKSRANGPWQEIMKAYILPAKPGENNALEEVFHLK